MMAEAKQTDAWLYACQLVERALPHLPLHKSFDVGQFNYDYQSRFDFRFSSKETKGIVSFNILQGRRPEYFDGLICWDKTSRHVLSQDEISVEAKYELPFPHFHYKWSAGTVNPDEKGKLAYLRVDVSGRSFADYKSQTDWKAWRQGTTGELPDYLTGVKEILGTAIPWQIDYDERAREILNTSGLEEFVKALEENAKITS